MKDDRRVNVFFHHRQFFRLLIISRPDSYRKNLTRTVPVPYCTRRVLVLVALPYEMVVWLFLGFFSVHRPSPVTRREGSHWHESQFTLVCGTLCAAGLSHPPGGLLSIRLASHQCSVKRPPAFYFFPREGVSPSASLPVICGGARRVSRPEETASRGRPPWSARRR